MPNSTKRKDGDWAAPILVAAVVSILGVVLVGLMLVLFWILPYIFELFDSMKRLFTL